MTATTSMSLPPNEGILRKILRRISERLCGGKCRVCRPEGYSLDPEPGGATTRLDRLRRFFCRGRCKIFLVRDGEIFTFTPKEGLCLRSGEEQP